MQIVNNAGFRFIPVEGTNFVEVFHRKLRPVTFFPEKDFFRLYKRVAHNQSLAIKVSSIGYFYKAHKSVSKRGSA